MTSYRYQGTPAQPPPATIATRSGVVTDAIAGTKYFWLQYRNRVGYSNLSSLTSATLAVGTGFDVTVPGVALPNPNGSDIREYLLLMSVTPDPANACVVATFPGYNGSGVVQQPPFTVSLIEDEHFILSGIVATAAQLPAQRVRGTRRLIDDQNAIVAWNGTSWQPVKPVLFNTYVSSDQGLGGAAIDISSILDTTIVEVPDYAVDSSPSEAVGFWLVNSTSVPIPRATPIGLSVGLLGEDISTAPGIVGGLELEFLGYANTLTGILDVSGEGGAGQMPGINQEPLPYLGPQTALALPKALPPDWAYVLRVRAAVSPFQLNLRVPQGATLDFSPFFFVERGVYNPSGNLFGTLITADFKRRRLVPRQGLLAVALEGSGQIVLPSGPSFTFSGVGQQAVYDLQANTGNQQVAITTNGTCLVQSGVLPETAVPRAYVGTVDGVGKPSAWKAGVTLAPNKQLQVTVNYPANVRFDYPDVIAGSLDGQFNATWVRVYIRPAGGGSVRQYEALVTPGSSSDTFVFGNSAGTVLGDVPLPTRPDPTFGCYELESSGFSLTAVDAASFFTTTEAVEVAVGFRYSETVTSVNHSPAAGCIYEASGTIAEVFEASKYWAAAVSTRAALDLLPATAVVDLQVRAVREDGDLYQYLAAQGEWRLVGGDLTVANLEALRAIPVPIRSWRRFYVESLQCYTHFNPLLTGRESGNGIFKPLNLGDADMGRHQLIRR